MNPCRTDRARPTSRPTSRPRTALGLVTLLGAVLLLGACGAGGGGGGGGGGGDGGGGGGDPSAATPDLAGRTFISTGVTGRTLVPGSVITLSFLEAALSANAGCNTLSGPATWAAGTLIVPEGALAATQMACEPGLMAQDTWLAAFLTSKPALTLVGTRLVLAKDGVSLTLVEEQALPLEGTTWTLTATIANAGVTTVPEGVISTLTIPPAGTTMQVQAGCNSMAPQVTRDEGDSAAQGTLTIATAPITLMACEGEAAKVEQHVISVLEGQVDYTIDGDTLTLKNGDLGLVYAGS
jgi:heat shock protein HslJ